MSEITPEFGIPYEESRRGRASSPEQKALAGRLGSYALDRIIDRPRIGGGRNNRRNRLDIDIPTGGIPGYRDPTGTDLDIDGDGWVDEGTKRPRWIGIKPRKSKRGATARRQLFPGDDGPEEISLSSGSGSKKLKIVDSSDSRVQQIMGLFEPNSVPEKPTQGLELSNEFRELRYSELASRYRANPYRFVEFENKDGTKKLYMIANTRHGDAVWAFDTDALRKIVDEDPIGQKLTPYRLEEASEKGLRNAVVGILHASPAVSTTRQNWEIYGVNVSGSHKRRGIASAMFKMHRDTFPELQLDHSRALTDSGKAFAQATPISALASGRTIIRRQQTLDDYVERVAEAKKRVENIQHALDDFDRTGDWNGEKHSVVLSAPENTETVGMNSLSIDKPNTPAKNMTKAELEERWNKLSEESGFKFGQKDFRKQITDKLQLAKLDLEMHETLLERKKLRSSQNVIDIEDMSDDQIEQLTFESRKILNHPHGSRLFTSSDQSRSYVAHKGPSFLDGGVLDPSKSQGTEPAPGAPVSGNTAMLNRLSTDNSEGTLRQLDKTVSSLESLRDAISRAIDSGSDVISFDESLSPSIYDYGFTPAFSGIRGGKRRFEIGEKIPISKMKELVDDIEKRLPIEKEKAKKLRAQMSSVREFGGQYLSAHRSMLDAFNFGYYGRYWGLEIPESIGTVLPEWKRTQTMTRSQVEHPFMFGRWKNNTRAGIWLIDGANDVEIGDFGPSDEIQIVSRVKPIMGFSTPWNGSSASMRSSMMEDIGPALFARAIKQHKEKGKVDLSTIMDKSFAPDLPERESLSLSSGAPERPRYPRKPAYGPLLGRANELFEGVTTWEEFKKRYDDTEVTFIDYETTGLKFDEWNYSHGNGNVVQIGGVKVKNGKVVARFETYVNPGMPKNDWESWSQRTLKDYDGNPLTDEFLSDKPSVAEAHRRFAEWAGPNAIMGVQNAAFDKDVLEDALREHEIEWMPDGWIDLKDIAAMTLPRWSEENPDGPFTFDKKKGKNRPSNSLADITKYLGVKLDDKHHNADADAEATAESLKRLIDGAIGRGWSKDVLDEDKRRNYVQRSVDKFDKEIIEFNDAKAKYLIDIANNDRSETRQLSSGDNRARPLINLDTTRQRARLAKHRSRDYSYGDTNELDGGPVRRSNAKWLKGMTAKQMSKLLVPESEDQYFEMWLDDFAPEARNNPEISKAFRSYYEEFLSMNPWDKSEFSPTNIEASRNLIASALESNPIMKWAWETHGAPMIGVFSKEAINAYESIPSVAQKLELLQDVRGSGKRPFVAGRLSPRIDLLNFNPRSIIDREETDPRLPNIPLLFGTGEIGTSDHHIDRSLAGMLAHEWGHWLHFRALRDYENASKPVNRNNYYGSGNPNDDKYVNALAVAAEYNNTGIDSEMIARFKNGGDINETTDQPRTLTSYGNTNRAEAMAEGIVAYLHPNRRVKDRYLNEKLRRDVETLLGIDAGEEPWNSPYFSSGESLSSGIAGDGRIALRSRIATAKEEVKRARNKKIAVFDQDVKPEQSQNPIPDTDYAQGLYQSSITQLRRAKRTEAITKKTIYGTLGDLVAGTYSEDSNTFILPFGKQVRGINAASLAKADVMRRLSESVDFSAEDFIRLLDGKVDEKYAYASFNTADNFVVAKGILGMPPDEDGRRMFAFRLENGSILPIGDSRDLLNRRNKTQEQIEKLRNKSFKDLALAFGMNTESRSPRVYYNPYDRDLQISDEQMELIRAITNSSSDSNIFISQSDEAAYSDNWISARLNDALLGTMDGVDEATIEAFSNSPSGRLYMLRDKESGMAHTKLIRASDDPNKTWSTDSAVANEIISEYGVFSPDDWTADVITKDNYEIHENSIKRDIAIRKLSDEFGNGLKTKFYGTLLLDANTEEGRDYLKQGLIRDIIHTWAISSNNRNAVALTLQSVIRREFGLNEAVGWDREKQVSLLPDGSTNSLDASFDSAIPLDDESENLLRSIVRAQYEATQEYFKSRGITHIPVYRGTTHLVDKEIADKFADLRKNGVSQPVVRDTATMRPASSWTLTPGIAEIFAPSEFREDGVSGGYVVSSYVPVENILSTPFTGFGCLDEKEVVLLGKPIDIYVGKRDDLYSKTAVMNVSYDDFFSKRDFNSASGNDDIMDIMNGGSGRKYPDPVENQTSINSFSSGAQRVRVDQADLIKKSTAFDIQFEIDEQHRDLLRQTLKKGFKAGYTVEVDKHADVKTGIAVARNRHGMKFNVATEFDANGNPSDRLVKTFHAWMAFHGPKTFGNPREGAREVTLGGWVSNGTLFLDVVDVYPNTPENLRKARSLGKRERQIAITDLDELWKRIEANENLDSAFIATGGDGGQTLSIKTINTFRRMLDDLSSNKKRSGSEKLATVGPITRFNPGSKASAARRVRFTDHKRGSTEVDYFLAIVPGESNSNVSVRAYRAVDVDSMRETIARKRGIDKSDVRLSSVIDAMLGVNAERSNIARTKPVAILTASGDIDNPVEFTIDSTVVSTQHKDRGLFAAMAKMHRDVYPDIKLNQKAGSAAPLSSGKIAETNILKPDTDITPAGELPEYRMMHTAPNRDSGAPLHDLVGVYPEDIYSAQSRQYYGTGDSRMDARIDELIKSMRGKPNAKVTIYRAVPISDEKRIAELEKQKAYILRTGEIPPYVSTSFDKTEYYEKISDELNNLLDNPVSKKQYDITPGDWVTPIRQYAEEHGDSHLGGFGKYEVISKKVKASEIFTNGDSWLEWGYDDSSKDSLSSGAVYESLVETQNNVSAIQSDAIDEIEEILKHNEFKKADTYKPEGDPIFEPGNVVDDSPERAELKRRLSDAISKTFSGPLSVENDIVITAKNGEQINIGRRLDITVNVANVRIETPSDEEIEEMRREVDGLDVMTKKSPYVIADVYMKMRPSNRSAEQRLVIAGIPQHHTEDFEMLDDFDRVRTEGGTDGVVIGKANRNIAINGGEVFVVHDSIEIGKSARGAGIASVFNARNENLYKMLGAEAILTMGQSDKFGDRTGATHWARNGFTWAGEPSKQRFIKIIDDAVTNSSDSFSEEELKRISSLYKKDKKTGVFKSSATPEELVDFAAADSIFQKADVGIYFKRRIEDGRMSKISKILKQRGNKKNRRSSVESLSSGWNMNPDDLDGDLADYYEDGEYLGIPAVRHPLVYWIGPINVDMINAMYKQKLEATVRALDEGNYSQYIMLHERPYRLQAFLDVSDEMSNDDYWSILGDIWTDTENQWQNIDDWQMLLESDRPNRELIMTEDERSQLEKLPEVITIYRGYQRGKNDNGLSWTTDRSKADWFARRLAREDDDPAVAERQINKKDVVAFFSRRGENEIVLSRPPDIRIKPHRSRGSK